MSAIQIHGADKVIRNISNLPKQVRFATAQALNDTAKDVQTKTLNELLPSKFTLRAKGAPWQRPGTRFGFNIRPFATKDNLTATIGSQADWLSIQERGGLKTISGHRVPIPTEALKPKADVTRREQKPSRLLRYYNQQRAGKRHRARVVATPRPFLYEGRAMRQGIYIRTEQGLRSLYTFSPSVRITKPLSYEATGKALAERVFPGHFRTRLVRALATARL